MSWLRRLLGPEQAVPPAAPAAAAEATGALDRIPQRGAAPSATRVTKETYGEPIVTIPELDLVGRCATSPNERYSLVWQDSGWSFGQDGPRGRYLLVDGDTLVVDARMERPQDGKVADNGTFILNDWGLAAELAGKFHAFRSDGSEIVSRAYTANLLNNGLSEGGRLAVCQTCIAPGSPDSSVLTVFDLVEGAVIATWTAESGWANAYEFPPGGDRIRMVRRDRVPLAYSLAGEFIDRRAWLKDETARGTLYVIRKALAEGEAATSLSLDALRAGVESAIAEGDERFVADAWRLLGEIEEAAGDPAAALAPYDRALTANPKVSVAKRAAALRKALA